MFICIYKPSSQNKKYSLEDLSVILDHYLSIYENHIILGDFNVKPNRSILILLIESLNLFNIIKSIINFKGNSTCIDLEVENVALNASLSLKLVLVIIII